MSDKLKRPYKIAQLVASQVKASLEPFCERIEIAGSIRRGAPLCGDIEIVAIPITSTEYDLFGNVVAIHNELWSHLDSLLSQETITLSKPQRWGDKYRAFLFQTNNTDIWKVDLFTCRANNWGDTLLIRTGAREFSKWMVTPQSYGGALPEGFKHHQNMLWKLKENGETEEVHMLYKEEQWFDLCGIPFVPPEYRHENRWLSWIEQQTGKQEGK